MPICQYKLIFSEEDYFFKKFIFMSNYLMILILLQNDALGKEQDSQEQFVCWDMLAVRKSSFCNYIVQI